MKGKQKNAVVEFDDGSAKTLKDVVKWVADNFVTERKELFYLNDAVCD